MTIKDLVTLKKIFNQIKTPIFGVGVYAFNRLGLEKIVPRYRILALRYSLDTALIEKDIEVLSLEKGMGTKHIRQPRNATTVLKHERTKKYLQQFKEPALIVYKPFKKMEKTCQENGWYLMANSSRFGKELFENKIKFRNILEQLDLAVPPGEITPIDQLSYDHLMNKYGLPLVIQHPTRGGGKGTFFIYNQLDFEHALKKLKRPIDEENKKITTPPSEVIVSQFIQGPSPSITGCVTKHGVLSTNLQHQILDIPQLYNPQKGSGLFCGHDWTSSRFPQKVSQQAYQCVEKIGYYFKKYGYRGIFGLDFVLDEKTNQLYLTECNPRLLGSFPTLNMVQLLNNEVPILACHVLEFLDPIKNHGASVDCQIDVEKVNKLMRQEKIGAQMILHNLSGHWARNYQQLKAGVYKIKNNKLVHLRAGYDLKHLQGKEEFLITEGVPLRKSHFSPNRRLCRILTLNKVLEAPRQLTPWARQVSETVYQAFDIRPIKWIKIKKFFSPHFLAKG
jgi:predicted ATP-grasp superfamily ATP-dependent carboligase